jgi:hypothetical protein
MKKALKQRAARFTISINEVRQYEPELAVKYGGGLLGPWLIFSTCYS